ncbi:diguanylate phosphodiesterase [Syntrophobotulus glycolicus DSM 8271]|uniref:Diguanylate phosphodiesterase n=1 Tax=Syntrophobotulus glycolicus (strain DSM 8271 / FlGlyR) TaxID=645991 RepID=F0SVN3_SYNGF|nr:EAL domain-containing protein [Syntrophobotulus glycolicus]ADY54509.1 diguanylate phosphodiesterase [Syntrophobotulus glycolicus DSM 8271]
MPKGYEILFEDLEQTALFHEILSKKLVSSVFQAIFELAGGNVLGYEALGRGPCGSSLHSPLALLRLAEKNNKSPELNLLFWQAALEKITNIHFDQYLFLNIDPQVIGLPHFHEQFTRETFQHYNISPRLIVLEISERTVIEDYPRFRQVLTSFTDQGCLIALDDVGAGYSGLKTISELKPDYLKIDMDLVRNIDRDQYKQSMVKALVDISLSLKIKLIAEGIETTEELQTISALGVQYGQGFLLHKPQSDFSTKIDLTYEKLIKN